LGGFLVNFSIERGICPPIPPGYAPGRRKRAA